MKNSDDRDTRPRSPKEIHLHGDPANRYRATARGRIQEFVMLFAICLLAAFWPAAADAQQVGSTVDFDRVTSNNPNLGTWDRGVITGIANIAGKPYLKIRNKAGTPYTIPNDPRWIHVVDPASAGPAPDGTRTGPYPNSAGGPATGPAVRPAQPPAPTRTSSSGRFPAGTRVQFDRAEGSKPEYGRWDDGTVIGTDQWGRVQIRGANGITYSIHDDPRWILPAGAPLPGPRHDYLDHPPPPAAANAGPPPSKTGAAGPLAGEWVVTAMDGKPTGGNGMTFNFVGARYELIFQGTAQSGAFTVSGNTVRMTGEDGAHFGTFQFSIQGNRLELKSPQADFVLQRARR